MIRVDIYIVLYLYDIFVVIFLLSFFFIIEKEENCCRFLCILDLKLYILRIVLLFDGY